MKKVVNFIKQETVLLVAWILAIISNFFIPPGPDYIDYIDLRSLGILWSLMVIMQGLKENGVFKAIGMWLLAKTKQVWQLCTVLIFLCFFSSMFITNDVALITFVPFAVMMLQVCKREELLIPVIVLQTIAANLGSMLTPIGNPQNLYLYGISGLDMGEFVLWMIPYTMVSAALLLLSILFLKGKAESVTVLVKEKQSCKKGSALAIGMYGLLFALALLVVGRVLSYVYLVVLVFLIVFTMEKKTLLHVDYSLLLTFVGFFIFTGNMGKIPVVHELIARLIVGREIGVGMALSQFISNVPATLLLAGFTTHYKQLLLGVNIGGLGTLIASMASLISYKIFANEYNSQKGKYLLWFTVTNIIFAIILLMMTIVCVAYE